MSPENLLPHVLSRVSLISPSRFGSSFSVARSSFRLPAVAAHGVMMSRPISSAIEKVRALRVSWRRLLACLIMPAPQLVAPSRGTSSMPNERATGSIVSATSVALLWDTFPGW